MKCSECGFDNKPSNKFCIKCGTKLALKCPQCNSEIESGAIFCGECGHNLTQPSEVPPKELSFDEKIRKIQKYLPKGLTEKILSQRDRIEGENKQVTVMFCDMEGFTPLVDKLGPEDAYSIMDEIYEILIHKVHDYEGTVNEMTGDGIMALFGAPIALEDAPQRAIRSAYSIHREMTRFSDKIKQERGDILPLKMRIGIHTGPVVVGTLGNDLRVEFKAVGDTVNLASRMEDLAEPGATYVSEETFKLTEGFFRYESLGEKEVKGKEEPIKTYRVIGPSTRRTRFEVSAERGLTPFIGRERELELLLDAFERSKEGLGQAASIVAGAGVGKSRLLYEFRKAVANEDVTFLEGKSLSYSSGVAYRPVVDILKGNFDIREGEEDIDIKDKVIRGLKSLQVDETSTLPYLLELLSVKESGIDITLAPETRKDRTIQALNRILLKGCEIRPLILAVEDLHWMDKNSEEVFKYLLEHVAGARVLLLFTYRTEYVHSWGGRSYHSQLTLNRLSNRETLAMVIHLLGTENIPANLENLILEKTEGVPFFVEEFLKSLIDLKILERHDHSYILTKDPQDVSIPSTIQDMLMARADALPEGAKDLLQSASAIEREFNHELIQKVAGLPEPELLSHLSVLKDAELLYERGIYPQSTYLFKHALTREVAYGSILSTRKKRLHSSIGTAMEEIYQDTLNEYYGILCEHFIIAEDYEKAAEYARMAGRQAEKEGLFIHAVPYNEKAITCLEELPSSEEVQKKIIDVRTTLALYLMQMGNWSKAKTVVEPVIDVINKMNYKKRMAQINMILGAHENNVQGENEKSIEYLTKALDIAKEINHRPSIQLANYWLAAFLHYDCQFERCLAHIQKALDINIEVKVIWGIAAVKSTQAMYLYGMGRIELAYQVGREALQLAEDNQDIYAESFACTYYGYSCFCKGLLKEAIEHLLRAVEVSERISGFRQIYDSKRFLGECYLTIGNYDKAIELFEAAIFTGEQVNYARDDLNLTRTMIEIAKVKRGQKGIDLASLYVYEHQNKGKVFQGQFRRNIGFILLHVDNKHITEAEDWIKKAIGADEKNGMMFGLGQDYALFSELFKRKGDQTKAKENLGKAIEILKECGADGWVEKYEKELPSL